MFSRNNFGYNALTGDYEDLVKAGVLDPTKVVRTALTNAGSIASLMLTTEALVAEIPEEKKAPAGGGGHGGGMGDMWRFFWRLLLWSRLGISGDKPMISLVL